MDLSSIVLYVLAKWRNALNIQSHKANYASQLIK